MNLAFVAGLVLAAPMSEVCRDPQIDFMQGQFDRQQELLRHQQDVIAELNTKLSVLQTLFTVWTKAADDRDSAAKETAALQLKQLDELKEEIRDLKEEVEDLQDGFAKTRVALAALQAQAEQLKESDGQLAAADVENARQLLLLAVRLEGLEKNLRLTRKELRELRATLKEADSGVISTAWTMVKTNGWAIGCAALQFLLRRPLSLCGGAVAPVR